jgi:hypothetical protein
MKLMLDENPEGLLNASLEEIEDFGHVLFVAIF